MRTPKSNSYPFIFTLIVTVALAVALFGSAPQQVRAQDVATPTPEVEIQIVGGALATPGEWPWQVALIGHNNIAANHDFWHNPGYQFCGGALIDPQWVLTAAHCITEDIDGSVSLASSIDIVAGISDLIPVSSDWGYQRRAVTQIIRHPSYVQNTFNNDIALLKLASPITLGGSGATKTAVIPLISAAFGDLTGTDAWVTGWGDTNASPSTDFYPEELYEVSVPIISNTACNHPSRYGGDITANMMCAGYDSGGYDACQGDSGGPLAVYTSGEWKLAGVVSWGSGCGEPLSPGVYTRVSNYVSWVAMNIDTTAPTVSSVTRVNASPSAATSVNFLVTFSEAVTGVDVLDFSLNTADVVGAAVINVSGSGATRLVTVNTGSGDGTIRLDVNDDDSILDLAMNPLNGGFTSGEMYAINKPDLPASVLRSPRTGTVTNVTMPTFLWTSVRGASSYEIEFANDAAFSSNLDNEPTTATSYTVITPFVDGDYFWHVRALNSSDQPGAWSSIRTFTINTTGPSAPVLTSPSNGANTRTPTFRWLSVPGAVLYEFQYDNDADLLSPTYTVTTRSTFRRPPAMGLGMYYWHVRAKDASGNWSAWSTSSTVTITNP